MFDSLKTLKDLEVFWDSSKDRIDKISFVRTNELRHSAILRAKMLKKIFLDGHNFGRWPPKFRSMKKIVLFEIIVAEGSGENADDPIREVHYFCDEKGDIKFIHDPHKENAKIR